MADIQSGYRRIPGADTGAMRALRQRLYRIRYDSIDLARRFAGRWKLATLMLLVQASMLTFVWWQSHAHSPLKSVLIVGAFIFAANGLVMFELNLRRQDVVSQAKSARKLLTGDIIDQVAARFQRVEMTADERRAMEAGILYAVASAVAGAFALTPTDCTASLLRWSRDAPTERLRVLARSQPGRQIDVEYPKHGMLAYYAMDEKRVAVTGEVDKEYEGFRDKPYRSVISFPVIVAGAAIAAVSVDCKRRFLFTGRQEILQTMLHPYIRLLALVLSNVKVVGEDN